MRTKPQNSEQTGGPGTVQPQSLRTQLDAADRTAIFAGYPPNVSERLQKLRAMIIRQAALDPEIGELHETLKWGQLSYLTKRPQSGTTIRLGTSKVAANAAAIFVHCQTPLINHFRQIFGELFEYESTRALICPADENLAEKEIAECISLALRYHLDKKTGMYS